VNILEYPFSSCPHFYKSGLELLGEFVLGYMLNSLVLE